MNVLYGEDDPRYWRQECDDTTTPIKEYFDHCKNFYLNLNWISHVQIVNSWPYIFVYDDGVKGSQEQEVRHSAGRLVLADF